MAGRGPEVVGQEELVPDPGQIRVSVVDAHGDDGHAAEARQAEETAAEGQDAIARGGGSLGEAEHRDALGEGAAGPQQRPRAAAGAAPVDEDDAERRGARAQQGPAAELVLGDGGAGPQGAEQDRVEVAQVVGHQDHRTRRARAPHVHLDPVGGADAPERPVQLHRRRTGGERA